MSKYLIEERCLGEDVLSSMQVTTKEFGNLGFGVSFPYLRGGVVYAEKFRTEDKRFLSTKDVSRGMYNEDALKLDGAVVIVEGEIDCLSVIQSGWKKCISLPNGWSENATSSDPLVEVKEQLESCSTIVVAGDNDRSGEGLPAFVSRMLIGHDVRYVEWPEGCKDANDVLCQYGPTDVLYYLQNAVKIDPEGGRITSLANLPPMSERRVLRTGTFADNRVALELGSMSVLTGYPGTGKSTLSTWLAYKTAINEKVNVGLFSFETHPHRTRDHVCRLHTGFKYDAVPTERKDNFLLFADKQFFIVHRTYDTNTNHNLGWLLDNIQTLAVRDRCKLIVVDPWNELEHLPEKGESLTQYINYALQQIRALAEKLNVHVMIVAHPRKTNNDGGPKRAPTGYDVADSAAFSNKPSLGISVFNEIDENGLPILQLVTWKVRDTQLYGVERGISSMNFDDTIMGYAEMYDAANNNMPATAVR